MKLTPEQLGKRHLLILAKVMKRYHQGFSTEQAIDDVLTELAIPGALEDLNNVIIKGGDDV